MTTVYVLPINDTLEISVHLKGYHTSGIPLFHIIWVAMSPAPWIFFSGFLYLLLTLLLLILIADKDLLLTEGLVLLTDHKVK